MKQILSLTDEKHIEEAAAAIMTIAGRGGGRGLYAGVGQGTNIASAASYMDEAADDLLVSHKLHIYVQQQFADMPVVYLENGIKRLAEGAEKIGLRVLTDDDFQRLMRAYALCGDIAGQAAPDPETTIGTFAIAARAIIADNEE